MPSQTAQVMQRIYDENPTWWPYGLKESQLDQTYLVNDPKSKKVAGFVGWQFRNDPQGKKVGYYAVGILPEFRRQGLAKKALQELFTKHQPEDVKERRAFIVTGNKASTSLAESLGVPVDPLDVPSLHPAQPEAKLASKMPKFGPSKYTGVSMQQFMPTTERRNGFTPDENAAIEEGQSQWFPRVFKSWADSPATDMAGPGRTAILAGLGAGGLTGLGLHAAGVDPKTRNYGALGVGALGAMIGYLHRRAKNNDVEEQMRRIPPNGTRRDVLSDPVLQAEMNRSSRDGSSEEAMRTAQLLAVMQAAKQAGVKAAGWGDIGKAIAAHVGRNPRIYSGAAGVGGAAAWDAALYNGQYPVDQLPLRGAMGLLNAAMLGRGAFKGNIAKPFIAIPAKDLAVSAGLNLPTFASAARKYTETPAAPPPQAPSVNVQPSTSSFSDAAKWVGDHPWMAGGGALAGAGLLAGGGMMAADALKSLTRSLRSEAGGRIKVTLPTKRQGDMETQLDLPVSEMPLSSALLNRLHRDARRKLNTETNERKRKLNLSPEEIARRTQQLAAYHS